MTGEPSWFEIGGEDAGRSRVFYGELLGWSFDDYGEGEGGMTISTPGLSGGLHGGDPGGGPYLFFRVDDLDSAMARVRELGGTIDDVPGADPSQDSPAGRFVLCRDDQGSPFGLHQPPADSPD